VKVSAPGQLDAQVGERLPGSLRARDALVQAVLLAQQHLGGVGLGLGLVLGLGLGLGLASGLLVLGVTMLTPLQTRVTRSVLGSKCLGGGTRCGRGPSCWTMRHSPW